MRAVTRRLLPFLMLCFAVAYLDRSNIAFAALQMNEDLKLTASAFGFGAGLFFVGYCLFEVPSNIMLQRVGARRWIARIMLTWGLLAGAMAFVWNDTSFYVMRFLFGAAEAGFYPGVIYYLSRWYPAAHRGRVIGYFMAAVPISGMIAAPLSGALLSLDGYGGLQGWQWLFIVEAAPAVLLAPVALRLLTESPQEAVWLRTEHREWLVRRLAVEATRAEASKHGNAQARSVLSILSQPLILALCAVYFVNVSLNNAVSFFMPMAIKQAGLSDMQTGVAAVAPSFVALLGLIWWSRHSDQANERKWHVALALIVGGSGLALAAMSTGVAPRLIGFSLALAGAYSATPCFWAMATQSIHGRAAAGGIAVVSAVGMLGGFVMPSVIGVLADRTGTFATGQGFAAALSLLAGLLLATFWRGTTKAVSSADPSSDVAKC